MWIPFFPLSPVFSCHVFICRMPAFLLQIAQQRKTRPRFYCLHSASRQAPPVSCCSLSLAPWPSLLLSWATHWGGSGKETRSDLPCFAWHSSSPSLAHPFPSLWHTHIHVLLVLGIAVPSLNITWVPLVVTFVNSDPPSSPWLTSLCRARATPDNTMSKEMQQAEHVLFPCNVKALAQLPVVQVSSLSEGIRDGAFRAALLMWIAQANVSQKQSKLNLSEKP